MTVDKEDIKRNYRKDVIMTLLSFLSVFLYFCFGNFVFYSSKISSISPDGKIRVCSIWSSELTEDAMDGYCVYSKPNTLFSIYVNFMGYAAETSFPMGAQYHWSPDSRYFSIWQGKIPKFYYDFQKKANYNLEFLAYTITPSESYGFKNKEDWIDFLLKNRFSTDMFLLSAVINGDINVVKYLLSKNATINSKKISSDPPLVTAASYGHEEIVKILIEHGADVNINKYGVTACRVAASKGYDAIMKILLENHADIEFQGEDGYTALMSASMQGHVSIIKILLDHGVSTNAKNKEGKTALDLAKENHHEEIVRLFMEYSGKKEG